MKDKKVAFIHFKTGERDGVSLEIEKRAKILQSLGAKIFYITGFDGLKRENAYLVEGLNAETSYNQFLREQCFRQQHFDEHTLLALYYQLEWKIYNTLQQAFDDIRPDIVFVHNVFSHGCNLAASTALLKALDKYEIPTIAVHHDFWYERQQLQHPQYPFIQEILDVWPPKRSYILKHQVINSLAAGEIQRQRGIQPETIGDYFDFSQPLAKVDNYNQALKSDFGIGEHDLLVLHATRITPHKVIENAMLFSAEFERQLREIAPIKFGQTLFKQDSKAVLFFPNFVEPEAVCYFRALKEYQKELGIQVVWASERFLPERREEGGEKIYSFWDSYVFADLVTYTSIQEGFGNQFLEAVYFKKIPIILEYPVFEKDLKHEGYSYVSLGSSSDLVTQNGLELAPLHTVQQAVKQTISTMCDMSTATHMVEKNFQIAKTHHDVERLYEEFERLAKCLS